MNRGFAVVVLARGQGEDWENEYAKGKNYSNIRLVYRADISVLLGDMLFLSVFNDNDVLLAGVVFKFVPCLYRDRNRGGTL